MAASPLLVSQAYNRYVGQPSSPARGKRADTPVERTDQMKPDEKSKLIADLKTKYPNDTLYEHSPQVGDLFVIYKGAGRKELHQMRLDGDDPATKDVADERFVKSLVVYPDAKGFEALLTKLPFYESNLCRAIIESSGGKKSAPKEL